jgi:colanic acid biosynthesis glycosyl transferase WcaI
MRAELERLALGLPHVRMLPLQPEEGFNEFLNLGDIHLLPQRSGVADLVMPSKLGAMLAAGRAVIATMPPGTQVARMLDGVGVVVPPEDAAALAHAIAALAGDGARRAALGAAARILACRVLRADVILAEAERRLLQFTRGAPQGKQDCTGSPPQ